MSEDIEHGYTWGDVRSRPADGLAVGDTWVVPGVGSAYFTDAEGRVRGAGIAWEMPMDGVAWTLLSRDGDEVTARSHTGVEQTGVIQPARRVLVVTEPEPVGTVLTVNSHRAADRLERALGRRPAGYYDKARCRGGKFIVLYGEDVATALGIQSITRTRLKPEGVALCVGEGQRERRDADRAAGRKVPEATS